MTRASTAWQVLGPLLTMAAVLSVPLDPAPARADGLLEALRASEEITYSLLSTKTRDVSGTTTTLEAATYASRTTARLNYNLLPTLSLNVGGTYDKNLSNVSVGQEDTETEITRVRPYAWLTLRDPVVGAAVGYDRTDDTVETAGQATTLTREAYNANLTWRPLDLPSTQARYTRTLTRDADRELVDTERNQYYVKSEYAYRGLNLFYAGNFLNSHDNIQDADSTLLSHEWKGLYATTLLDGRVSFTTDNRIRNTEITATRAGVAGTDTAFALQQAAAEGRSAVTNTITPLPLGVYAVNAALIDGDTATSAGVDIGSSGSGGPRRQIGLDFGAGATVARLLVWVTGFPSAPPATVTNSLVWDVYTSTDNVNWTPHALGLTAAFGPFDFRFVIDFPTTTARFIKVVTLPLSVAVPGAASFPNIVIAELQAFATGTTATGGQAGRERTTYQTVRTHNLDIRTVLLRTPSLFYRFTGNYEDFQPNDEQRYGMLHGLDLTHRFNPIFTGSANVSLELGTERDQTPRSGILYYASLSATPLKTLTDSFVVSGSRQKTGRTTTTNHSVVLYNTAQLYQGIDATLNVGAALGSSGEDGASTSRREEYWLNLGTGITPHPRVALTTYYLGRISQTTGGNVSGSQEATEHRLDLGLSLTPFRAIVVSAAANIEAQSNQETRVSQTYGLSWAPFRDGTLQFAFSYVRSEFLEDTRSETIRPTVRWYLGPRRRSYLEVTYQLGTSETSTATTESTLLNASLNIYY